MVSCDELVPYNYYGKTFQYSHPVTTSKRVLLLINRLDSGQLYSMVVIRLLTFLLAVGENCWDN